jgi:hypothetical protein
MVSSRTEQDRRLFRWERHDVVKHEHYRELCAAASIGQATPEELLELEQHASECEACSQAYFDYLNLAAQQFAAGENDLSLTPQRARESLNSELFTRRFFERAEREGIQFSSDVGHEVKRLTPMVHAPRSWKLTRTSTEAIAAVVLLGLALPAGYFYARRSFHATPDLEAKKSGSSDIATSSVALDQRIAELTATNAGLEAQIANLKAELGKASEQLNSAESGLTSISQDREKLAADRDALEAQLRNVQAALVASKALAANAQQEAAKQQNHSSDVEATLLADEVTIHNLTDQLSDKSALLDQERQLLALGHDVSDLMGARNLHIVDVVDTDPRGKTQPAFGRIFFTEGKSLVFYAYDLNDAKMQRTNYQYGVWAKKEGGDKQVQRLGIFYSDDKAQRRWVFKCNDPKLLTEIDSVFVTLEPTNGDPSRPKGPNLMYAYLRGQPNHP